MKNYAKQLYIEQCMCERDIYRTSVQTKYI